ncbi:MAG: hypothetical protein ACLVKB_02775 [Agathobacter rectalis]
MERLTSNKKVSDMSMIELAHNSCYADDEHNARYRDYEMDMDARAFARSLMVTLTKDKLPISDTEFDEEILDDLAIDPFSDVRGLIALFYRNLWAMANLRETLKKYEDLEEHGKLIKIPLEAYCIVDFEVRKGFVLEETYNMSRKPLLVVRYDDNSFKSHSGYLGISVFLTKSEAEAKLKGLRDGENDSMES